MKVSKKILFITFFIICISSNFVFAATGKVTTQATRIRKEANTSSTIVTVIYENDEVEILEESGEWYKIKYKDYTGYVKKEFIKLNDESSKNSSNTTNSSVTNSQVSNSIDNTSSETIPDTQISADTIVLNSEIYARLLPNFSSNNIVKFEASKQVEKINELNNWVQVTDGTNTGWILKNKLQEKHDIPTQTEVKENQNTTANSNSTNTITNSVENTTTNTTTNTTKNANNTTTNTQATSSINKTAKITVETAKVREEASTTSNVLGFLDYGDEVTLLEQNGDWYKINFENKTGYIKNTLFEIIDSTVSSRSLTEERQDVQGENVIHSENASEVVSYAKQYLGYPYIVGGKTPATGFDCSGFTRYIFLNFGYSLGSTAASQTDIGIVISRENLEPGDLILFLNEEKTGIGHTGIYIGNGEFIHSANPQRGVVIDNLNTNSYYSERFVSARRIVNN